VIGILDSIDASRIEAVIAPAERLSELRLFVVTISGRLIAAPGAPPLDEGEHARVHAAAARLYRERAADGLRDGAVTAHLIFSQGVEVGAAVALGEGRGPEHRAVAAQTLRGFVEALVSSEHEIESLTNEIVERYEEVNLLYDLSESLAALLDERAIAQVAVERGVRATKARVAAVLLERRAPAGKAPSSAALAVVAATGADVEPLLAAEIPADDPFVRAVRGAPEGVVLEDRVEFPFSLFTGGPGGAAPLFELPLLAVSIRVGAADRGILLVGGAEIGQMFGAGDAKILLSIANQTAIAIQKIELIEEVRQSERVSREMEIAETIQSRLVPDGPPPTVGLQIAGRSIRPSMVGGDYYDYIASAPDCVSLVMADVTGHNFGSAIVMAIARSVIRGELAKGTGPAEVLGSAARILYPDLSNADLLITAFLARWDGAAARLTYANAGHNPGLLWHARERRVERLDADGIIIGVLEEPEYEERHMPFEAGDVLVLYTDGVVEARDASGAFFGEERLTACLERSAGSSAQEIVEAIGTAFDAFRRGRDLHDDVSLVVARVAV
jgi:serine phosphatase RsbU (regulator of sigma subunit)